MTTTLTILIIMLFSEIRRVFDSYKTKIKS